MQDIDPPAEEAQPLLRLIVEAINSGRIREGDPRTFLSYSEALSLLKVASPGVWAGRRLQKHGLKALNTWTMIHPDLPKISALIVNKKTHIPSDVLAWSPGHLDDPDWKDWWLREANRAINYDWSPFIAPIRRHRRAMPEDAGVHVREGEEEAPAYSDVIVVDPPPAQIRQTRITVNQILRWMAAGQSESDILRRNPGLRQLDIRASLAYAADREKQLAQSRFTDRWAGKFTLPAPDPADARLTYLLGRYERNRK